jgi:Cu+-exporting ATPase
MLPAKRKTSSAWKPRIGSNDVSRGRPSVNVPVLSTANVFARQSTSSAAASRTRTPVSAPRPVPTITAIGVASPSAHGHAMISTATARTKPCAMRGFHADEVLRLAGSIEQGSEHPLAAAIVKAAKARGLAIEAPSQFQATPGKGVKGKVDGRDVVVGTALFLAGQDISSAALEPRMAAHQAKAETTMLVGVDGKLAAMMAVSDPIRATTPEAIRALQAEGMRIVMLTGDTKTTAEAVGKELGLHDIHAGATPASKRQTIQRLRQEGKVVAMAGDGINDAPALAEADIGIAMGTGTDVAMESAGVTLIKGDLGGIVRARKLSEATMRTIRQNLFLAFVYNAVSVPAAAVGLLNPMWASAAMSLSSVSVVVNSLREK